MKRNSSALCTLHRRDAGNIFPHSDRVRRGGHQAARASGNVGELDGGGTAYIIVIIIIIVMCTKKIIYSSRII